MAEKKDSLFAKVLFNFKAKDNSKVRLLIRLLKLWHGGYPYNGCEVKFVPLSVADDQGADVSKQGSRTKCYSTEPTQEATVCAVTALHLHPTEHLRRRQSRTHALLQLSQHDLDLLRLTPFFTSSSTNVCALEYCE